MKVTLLKLMLIFSCTSLTGCFVDEVVNELESLETSINNAPEKWIPEVNGALDKIDEMKSGLTADMRSLVVDATASAGKES